MKTAFICVGSAFTPTMLYKENLFIKAAVNAGHEVLVLASETAYVQGELQRQVPSTIHEDGYVLTRYPSARGLPSWMNEKTRIFPGMLDDLTHFAPDLVYFNVPQVHGLRYVKRLKKMNPRLRAVCHYSTTLDNSGTNWVSRSLLHGVLYRRWISSAAPFVDSVYYISPESKQFLLDVYRIPGEDMDLLPLPGELVTPTERVERRSRLRQFHGILDDDVVFFHSGKMNSEKGTVSLIRTFSANPDRRARLLLAGSFAEEIRNEVRPLLAKDERIAYLGFLEGNELTDALCATDLYLQPGTASQTAQTALCCGTPIAVLDLPIYRDLLTSGGVLLRDGQDVEGAIENSLSSREDLRRLSGEAFELAKERLDYRALFKELEVGRPTNVVAKPIPGVRPPAAT